MSFASSLADRTNTGNILNQTGGGSKGSTGGLSPASKKPNDSSIAPIITSLLGIVSTGKDIETANEALMANMANQAETHAYGQNTLAQQMADLDRVVGSQLSASGLEELKAESRLKVASAETGGKTQEAIDTAGVNRLHRDATLLRTADVRKSSKQSELVASRLGFENTLESMVSGMQGGTSAGLQTGSAGLKGMLMGLPMLSSGGKEKFFGTNTTGAK